MARLALEHALPPGWVDEVFEANRRRQYDKVNHTEPAVLRALGCGSAGRLAPVLATLGRSVSLPGWRGCGCWTATTCQRARNASRPCAGSRARFCPGSPSWSMTRTLAWLWTWWSSKPGLACRQAWSQCDGREHAGHRGTRYWVRFHPSVTSRMKSRTVALMNSTSSALKPGEAATWPCTEGMAT